MVRKTVFVAVLLATTYVEAAQKTQARNKNKVCKGVSSQQVPFDMVQKQLFESLLKDYDRKLAAAAQETENALKLVMAVLPYFPKKENGL